MLKRLNQILNILMGSFLGVFIGRSVYVCWEYKIHSDLYAIQSAPWYTSIMVYGIVTAVILGIAIVIKLIIRQKIKQS
mgnify:CR=1 FL=1